MSRKKKGRKAKDPVVDIVPLHNPGALEIQEIQDLFIRAFARHPWVDGKEMLSELEFLNLQHDVGCLLARRDSEWVGLAIVLMPSGRMFRWPLVQWLYGKGPVRIALGRACAAWGRERGFTEIVTANYRRDRSRSFVRLFGPLARQAKVVGEIVAFDLRE